MRLLESNKVDNNIINTLVEEQEGKYYEVSIGFCGFIGVENEYRVYAMNRADAVGEALDNPGSEAEQDLSAENIEDHGDGSYTVTINFAGFIGADNDYEVYADSEEEAEQNAIEEAKMDLEVISVDGKEFDYDDESNMTEAFNPENEEKNKIIRQALKGPKSMRKNREALQKMGIRADDLNYDYDKYGDEDDLMYGSTIYLHGPNGKQLSVDPDGTNVWHTGGSSEKHYKKELEFKNRHSKNYNNMDRLDFTGDRAKAFDYYNYLTKAKNEYQDEVDDANKAKKWNDNKGKTGYNLPDEAATPEEKSLNKRTRKYVQLKKDREELEDELAGYDEAKSKLDKNTEELKKLHESEEVDNECLETLKLMYDEFNMFADIDGENIRFKDIELDTIKTYVGDLGMQAETLVDQLDSLKLNESGDMHDFAKSSNAVDFIADGTYTFGEKIRFIAEQLEESGNVDKYEDSNYNSYLLNVAKILNNAADEIDKLKRG